MMKGINKVWAATLFLLTFCTAVTAQELFTPNCLGACPSGASSSDVVIVREDYTLSSNSFTKFADWAAYKVTRDTIGSGCTRPWKADPLLKDSQTLEPSDYRGAHAGLKTDRGHQVPLASFCNTKSWRETDYLSNITPQKSALNQGPWKRLEDKVRDLAKTGKTVYVLTGPLYEHPMPPLPNADEFHVVPSGYWKIISYKEAGEIHSMAFIFDQKTPRNDDVCNHISSLNELEKRSHLRFLRTITQSFNPSEKAICH